MWLDETFLDLYMCRQQSPTRLSTMRTMWGHFFATGRQTVGGLAETMVNQMTTHGMGGDRDIMLELLRQVSCYRVRGYAMHFNKSHDANNPIYDCKFEDVVGLYRADRTLRRIIFTAIDPIEVRIRASWAHHVETNYGPKGHLKSEIYKVPRSTGKREIRFFYDDLRKRLDEMRYWDRNIERKYSNLKIQPLSEKISFSFLSKFVGALKDSEVRKIGVQFDFGDRLESILRQLSVVRNKCAHHARIWNFRPEVIAELKYHKLDCSLHHGKARQHQGGRAGIYNTLALLAYMLKIIEPDLWQDWREDLFDLMDSEPFKDLAAVMGFPEDWKEREVWNAP